MLDFVKSILNKQAEALVNQSQKLDESFIKALTILQNTKGKIIISGIGKSGIIAKKISTTLSSLSSPSIFLCPFNALHGDIGLIQEQDCLILISNSGVETKEFSYIIDFCKNLKIKIISITKNENSFVAEKSDIYLKLEYKSEEILNIKPPYISTVLSLAIGDALAISLFKIKNLTQKDYLKNHPAGEIGKGV